MNNINTEALYARMHTYAEAVCAFEDDNLEASERVIARGVQQFNETSLNMAGLDMLRESTKRMIRKKNRAIEYFVNSAKTIGEQAQTTIHRYVNLVAAEKTCLTDTNDSNEERENDQQRVSNNCTDHTTCTKRGRWRRRANLCRSCRIGVSRWQLP